MSNEDDNFRNLIGGAFGQVEAQVGPEAYQAHTDVQKSIAEFNRAQVDMIRAQVTSGTELSKVQGMVNVQKMLFWKALTSIITFASLLFLLGVALPFTIGMWQGIF